MAFLNEISLIWQDQKNGLQGSNIMESGEELPVFRSMMMDMGDLPSLDDSNKKIKHSEKQFTIFYFICLDSYNFLSFTLVLAYLIN